MHATAARHGLELIVTEKGFRDGLAEVLQRVRGQAMTLCVTHNSVRSGACCWARARRIRGRTRCSRSRSATRHAALLGSLLAVAHGTQGWGDFVRAHPILDWDYAAVWTYLRRRHVPYCSLYDQVRGWPHAAASDLAMQGYTSLGSVRNTAPNPALRRSDGSYRCARAATGARDACWQAGL